MRARSSASGPIILQAEAVLGVEGLDWKLTVRQANGSVVHKYQYEILEFEDDEGVPKYLEAFWNGVDTDKEFRLGDVVTPRGVAEPRGDDISSRDRQSTRRQRPPASENSDEDTPRSSKRRKTNTNRPNPERREPGSIDVFEHHLPEHWRHFSLGDEDIGSSQALVVRGLGQAPTDDGSDEDRPEPRRRRSETVIFGDHSDADESHDPAVISAMEKRRNDAFRRAEDNRRMELLGQMDLVEARQQPSPVPEQPRETTTPTPIPIKQRLISGAYIVGEASAQRPTRNSLALRSSTITFNKAAGGLVSEIRRVVQEPSGRDSSHFDDDEPFQSSEGLVDDLFGPEEPDEELPDYEDTVEPEGPIEFEGSSENDSASLGGEFGDAGLLQSNEMRRWVPPQPPAGYVDPRTAAPPSRPETSKDQPIVAENNQNGFRFLLSFPFSISTINNVAKPTFLIHLTDFSKLPPKSDRSLNDDFEGVTKMLLFSVKPTSDFGDRSKREPYSIGAGMCAKVEVPSGDWHQKDRKLLAQIAEKMYNEEKYIIRRSQVQSVYLIFFPSSNVDMCRMLNIPKRFTGKDGVLLVSRVLLHHRA
ncbi:hypothetical protein FRC02_003984 [Tulasnella sp. 418]|nr:hypothetical protein FRC02_003984 [Tulasnella sp. 418]